MFSKVVPVTDPECSRFLFTLDDAVDTVLGVLDLVQGGEVFIPKIKSYDLQTVLDSLKVLCKTEDIKYTIVNMRFGEKIHKDMLAMTELDFTYEASDKLLVVTPQYTRKSHTYSIKYQGPHFNLSPHLSQDSLELLVDYEGTMINNESISYWNFRYVGSVVVRDLKKFNLFLRNNRIWTMFDFGFNRS